MAGETVIGVLPLYDDAKQSIWMLPAYLNAIEESGAVPVILPLKLDEKGFDKINSLCDGYLFTGGQDIDPALYGEENRGKCGTIIKERDNLEKMVFEKVYNQNKPVLGICRGLQIINALRGGTLYQDIPTENPSKINHHMNPPYNVAVHGVNLEKSSSLYKLLKIDSIGVNSYHHQAIKKPAKGFKVMARAEDGTIEAIEDTTKKFVWAVQWHPEYTFEKDENSRKIIKAFVDACK